ncbi:MAG: RNA methyltransferase [Clostridia bacterium]|nr:RNA methyltransferase [Clostridia bacterium]
MIDHTPKSVTSRANPLIVEAAKLQDKKHRTRTARFFFEGVKLFSEARAAGVFLERVIVTEEAYGKYAALFSDADFETVIVPDSVYEKITAENSPQGVFCLAKYLDNLNFSNTIYTEGSQFGDIINTGNAERILICDGLRDPGNLGTVIRTANALGFDRLVLSSDCADLYNPKTVRAAMGALFRIRADITPDIPAYIASLTEAGYDVRAAALTEDAVPLNAYRVTPRTVFVIGNEGHGLSEETVAACRGSVIIPMAEGAESLNAAIAASILMWECSRI